jgi:hypothetical protein
MRKVAIFAVLGVMAGCAGSRSGGTYQTNASYDRLYRAAIAAVPVTGFSVESSNKADGLIVAHQAVVMGNGTTVGLNVSVANTGTARVLNVMFMAPPGTLPLGNFDQNTADYVNAVRAQIPDLRP